MLFQFAHDGGDGGGLLSDGDVDAFHPGIALVNDGIHRNGSFSGLTVADNQLTLTATNRHHRIDGFKAGLQRLVNGLAFDNAGRDFFDGRAFAGFDVALAVNGLSEGIDNTPQQFAPDRHFEDASGTGDFVAFREVVIFAEDNNAHAIAFQVERKAVNAAGEGNHFPKHRLPQSLDAGDTVIKADNRAFGFAFDFVVVVGYFFLDKAADFSRIELHDSFPLVIEFLGEFGDSALQRLVNDQPVVFQHHSGKQCRVFMDFQHDFASGFFLHQAAQQRFVVRRKWLGARYAHHTGIALRIKQLVIDVGDFRQYCDAVVFFQKAQQVVFFAADALLALFFQQLFQPVLQLCQEAWQREVFRDFRRLHDRFGGMQELLPVLLRLAICRIGEDGSGIGTGDGF